MLYTIFYYSITISYDLMFIYGEVISWLQHLKTITIGIAMYEILKLIGRGANGDVFLARNKQDNSTQVIKKLKIRDITPKERQTIETELKLLKEFKHVNIVPFRDSFIDGEGNLNIVMGYCEGGDMHNLIQDAEGKKFSEKMIVDWIVQLALSIFYLHERRVLHRDIKTQNVFLTNGKIMLGDFGVSKVLDQAVDLAVTNIGTPYYMSPQQFRQKPYSYKSDIWAFGCIAYEMCSHKHVFQALSLQGLAIKVIKGIYAPISEEYPKQLRTLIGDMLKQNPKERPSIREILTRPYLFGKVQNYMKKIYSEKQKYEQEMIKSLVAQATSLGFSLQEPKPKKVEKEESTPKTSKSKSKSEENREKQKLESKKKYQKLSQKLKKEIEQRNRAQEQLQKITKQKNQKKKSTEKYSVQKPKTKREETSKTQRSNRSSKIKLDDLEPMPEKVNKIEKHEQKEEISHNFKIEEEYDMDYEEYSDKGDNEINKIYEQDQQEHEQKDIKTLKTETEQSRQLPKIAEVPIKPIITEAPKQQIKNVEQKKIKADLLEKEVKQKTIIISSIRNQISKLDFIISSDSEDGGKQQKIFNPVYTRITQKINDLKQKLIGHLKSNGYTMFLDFVRNNFGKVERNKVVQMVGEENVGLYHIAENVVKLDRVLAKIPMYCTP